MCDEFSVANSKLLSELQYTGYLMVRNSVTQHSTKNLISKSDIRPTRQLFEDLKAFFRKELKATADDIHTKLHKQIEELADAAPMIEYLRNTEQISMTGNQMQLAIQMEREQNAQLSDEISQIEKYKLELILERETLEKETQNLFQRK